jgi:hypothetical protein
MNLSTLANKAYEEVSKPDSKYRKVLADTRVSYITLLDHSLLTSGIAVACVKELFLRGKSTLELSGHDIAEDEAIASVRIASLFHDYGKVNETHIGHIERGVDYARSWLGEKGIGGVIRELILKEIERHHLRKNPESLLEKIVCLADSIASGGDRPVSSDDGTDSPKIIDLKTYDEIFKFTQGTIELEKEIFGERNGLALILGDTDRIKSYVYETTKLPAIRGASEILNNLNLEKTKEIFSKHLAPECLIYNGGGSFLGIAPVSLADTIKSEIEKAYLDETSICTISIVIKPLSYLNFARGIEPYVEEGFSPISKNAKGIGKWLLESHFGKELKFKEKKGFGEFVQNLAHELKREKETKEKVPFFEVLPIAERCQYCGKRATEESDKVGTDEFKVCSICKKNVDNGRKDRTILLDRFKNWIEKNYDVNEEIKKAIPCPDLDRIGDYIAFIYADGNEIGETFSKVRSVSSYRHFSEGLKEATENAIFEALYSGLSSNPTRKDGANTYFPFEILNIGGDDVAVLVPAPFSWKVALKFLEEFEERTKELAKELGKEKFTSSCGILIAKSSYPMHYTERLAEGLLKKAKKKAKEEIKSAVCHLYLTTSIASEDAEELLKDFYEREHGKFTLTLRPYTLEEAQAILDRIGDLKIATSQIYKLAQSLEKGIHFSYGFYLYQLIRGSVEGKENRFQKKIEDLFKKQLGCGEPNMLWKETEKGFATPLYDILELLKIGVSKYG